MRFGWNGEKAGQIIMIEVVVSTGQWLEMFGFVGRVTGHDGQLVGMIAGVKLFLTGFAVA